MSDLRENINFNIIDNKLKKKLNKNYIFTHEPFGKYNTYELYLIKCMRCKYYKITYYDLEKEKFFSLPTYYCYNCFLPSTNLRILCNNFGLTKNYLYSSNYFNYLLGKIDNFDYECNKEYIKNKFKI